MLRISLSYAGVTLAAVLLTILLVPTRLLLGDETQMMASAFIFLAIWGLLYAMIIDEAEFRHRIRNPRPPSEDE